MPPRFFRSSDGRYLGSFDGAPAPRDAIEVAAPPADGRATWSGGRWVDPPAPPTLVPLAVVLTRVIVLGRLNALLAVLQADKAAEALLLRLKEGIYANDAQARALLTAAGADPDVVLAA